MAGRNLSELETVLLAIFPGRLLVLSYNHNYRTFMF